jgi:cytochrome b561
MAEENYWQGNDVPVQSQEVVVEPQPVHKHSGMGIASFVISIVAGLIIFLLVVMAAVLTVRSGGQMNEESPEAVVIGCSMFAGMILYLIGVGLAIGGLCQRNRYKVFSVLGLIFNLAFLLGIVGLMIVGLIASR